MEAIDAFHTVVMPLQFAPLFEHKRQGSISLRNYLLAKGEIKPTEAEAPTDLSTLENALNEIELATIKDRRSQVGELHSALKQICGTWQDNCDVPLSLQRLPATVDQIVALLDKTIATLDPTAAISAEGEGGDAAAADGSQPAVPVGPVLSAAHAAAALAAAASYFSRYEPSSPALLLVRQASDLLGKSFVDVMRILVPAQVEKAAVEIGKDRLVHLPIERLAAFAEAQGDAPPALTDDVQFEAGTRAEALTLLDQVGQYFRRAEPSSPIPFLVERARDFAPRDFLSLLKAILPADTLKDGNTG